MRSVLEALLDPRARRAARAEQDTGIGCSVCLVSSSDEGDKGGRLSVAEVLLSGGIVAFDMMW